MPLEIQIMIRDMVKEAVLQFLLRKYIADLMECHGGFPMIEADPHIPTRPVVRVIAIKKDAK